MNESGMLRPAFNLCYRMVFLHDWEWDIVKRSGHDGCEVIITLVDGGQIVSAQPGELSQQPLS